MRFKEATVILWMALAVPSFGAQDTIIQINTMRWSQVVSERFLSLSIDPLAIILAGKLGPGAIHMAKGLSPIFVRIGGPNTENVRFGSSLSSRSNISVTEEEWVAVNKFAQEARLDLVLCLRAMRRTQTVWDSANALEIISASHKHGFTDIWQMGWDMSEMTGIGGAELGRDIVRLKKILDAFPGYENAPILAPGLSCCLNHFQTRFIKDLLHESATAVSALPVHLNFSSISLDKVTETIGTTLIQMEEQIWSKDLLLRSTLPRKPIWMSELEPNSGEFKDAMKWIVKLGSAARFGVQVMMRQPHLWSFHSPTHDYWASLLFKNLVGRFVFDTRVISGNKSSAYLYSHCTHPTNDDTTILSKWNYEKGALTVYGINPLPDNAKIVLRGLSVKEEMVHLYVLTEDTSDSSKDNFKFRPTNTLFNGQKLILSPKGELPLLSPKERRVSRGQAIPVPPQSIFFIVFPDVKVRTCISNPFTTEEFQDLTKRLTAPLSNSEDVIDSWEDNNAERVYVSFSKRVPVTHKQHTLQDDLKSKLLKDWHKVTGRLRLDKDHETDLENVKYNFYNDQTWLSRLADGLKKDSSEDILELNPDLKKPYEDSELSRPEKYALLTSAIYGKENNGTNLYQISGMNEAIDPYSHHYRFIRSAELSNFTGESKIRKNSDLIENPQKIISPIYHNQIENSDKLGPIVDLANNKTGSDKLKVTENYNKLHNYVKNYMANLGHKIDDDNLNSKSNHTFHAFVSDLGQVDVTVGEHINHDHPNSFLDTIEPHKVTTDNNADDTSKFYYTISDEIGADHRIKKRNLFKNLKNKMNEARNDSLSENDKNANEKMVNFDDSSSPLAKSNDNPSLSTETKYELNQTMDENKQKEALEVTSKPDLIEINTLVVTKSPETATDQVSDGIEGINFDSILDANDGNSDPEGVEGKKLLPEVPTDTISANGTALIEVGSAVANVTEDLTRLEDSNKDKVNTERPDDIDINTTNYSEGVNVNDEEHNYSQYSDDGLKEPPKLRRISELIEQLKAKGIRELGQTSAFKSAKLEERIQKLENFKSRVIEIKEKIKTELSKAREKLAQSVGTGKSTLDYNLNDQPSKRNIYDMPDKLAGLLERLNFNYMNNIGPKTRYRRTPVLTDDEIDEILEQELSETANEFYNEQLQNLEDEDYENHMDPSNIHYLVPAIPGTHNVLLNQEVFPAKIYNMIKGNQFDLDQMTQDGNYDFNNRRTLRDIFENYQNRKNLERYDQMNRDNLDLETLRSLLTENELIESKRRIFDPLNFNSYRKHFMRNRPKYGSLLRNTLYNEGNELPFVMYPRNILGSERYRRSLEHGTNPFFKELNRRKRSVNFNDIKENKIKKHLPTDEFTADKLKLKVDSRFKNSDASLHQLAEEYTKLAKEMETNESLSASEIINKSTDIPKTKNAGEPYELNKPVFDNINDIITVGERALSNGMNMINNVQIEDILKDNADPLNTPLDEPGVDNENETDESETDYSDDWINNAERVSPPLVKPKIKETKNTNDHRHMTPLGKLMEKIKHIIKFISEFRISDYVKGRKQ